MKRIVISSTGLEKAKAYLAALGAPEPALPAFDESRYEPISEIEIDQSRF